MSLFEVKVCKTEKVAAALPMQEHWLPLSNLDLLLPPVDFGVFFCYEHGETEQHFSQIVGALKKALALTLVSYYAFAGVLVRNGAGEPELLCNNSGVDFVEAVSDAALEDLNLYNPDDCVAGKLVPLKKHGVLAVQVILFFSTIFFKKIGFVFGLNVHVELLEKHLSSQVFGDVKGLYTLQD